jgi:hypothetical protein
MRRIMKEQLALLLFLTSTVLAQSRFDGTWEMKMDTLQFSGPVEDYVLEKGCTTAKAASQEST